MKTLRILLSVYSLIVASGCRPKETTFSGQVFIVTQGAANIPLGDAEVLLLKKSQVVEFLERRRLDIETEKPAREQEFASASQLVNNAQDNLNWFLTNRPFTTNLDYVRAKADYDKTVLVRSNIFEVTLPALQKTFPELAARYGQAQTRRDDANQEYTWRAVSPTVRFQTRRRESQALRDAQKYFAGKAMQDAENAVNNLRSALDKINRLVEQKEAEADELQQKMDGIERRAKDAETSKLTSAEARKRTVEERLSQWPSIEDYLQGFSPVAIQRARTDADGKFSITYPRDGIFTVFAKGQLPVALLARVATNPKTGSKSLGSRVAPSSLGSSPKKYWWLVNAPSGEKPMPVILSNSRLIDVDPDGYLKIKPKNDFSKPDSRAPAQVSAPATPIAHDWSRSLTARKGVISVTVASAEVGPVCYRDVLNKPQFTAPYLTVMLCISNASITKKVDFETWRVANLGAESDAAALSDNYGNNYKRISVTPAPNLLDPAPDTASIHPQRVFYDPVVFEVPLRNISWLHLELPAENFGEKGPLRFQIPTSRIHYE